MVKGSRKPKYQIGCALPEKARNIMDMLAILVT